MWDEPAPAPPRPVRDYFALGLILRVGAAFSFLAIGIEIVRWRFERTDAVSKAA